MSALRPWYLIRTKSNRESYVRGRLSRLVPEVFLPMLKLSASRSRVSAQPSVVPLFPQYLFARLDLSVHYFEVRYMPGVAGFVSAGSGPLMVSDEIVGNVLSRCTNGIVQLSPRPFCQGERVRVVDGPFCNFEAIFETYLSGVKRAAILIEAIEGRPLRVIADAAIIARP
jgi:transcriptional antiterminator RfaH